MDKRYAMRLKDIDHEVIHNCQTKNLAHSSASPPAQLTIAVYAIRPFKCSVQLFGAVHIPLVCE